MTDPRVQNVHDLDRDLENRDLANRDLENRDLANRDLENRDLEFETGRMDDPDGPRLLADEGPPTDRQLDPSFPAPGPSDHVGADRLDPSATGDTTAWPVSESPADTTAVGIPATGSSSADGSLPGGTLAGSESSLPGDLQTGAGQDEAEWRDLQARFVDEPQVVTREAAQLVDRAVARLTQDLAAAGGDGSTENLRNAFRRYREVYRTLSDA